MRTSSHFTQALENALKKIQEIEKDRQKKLTVFWFHVASAGELEQAIPVARTLSDKFSIFIFLTVFSPSALPFLKNFPGLIGSCGMPLDLVKNHERLLHTLSIQHVFFVRYDLWPGILRSCRKANIPVSVLAATASTTRNGFFGFIRKKINTNRYKYAKNLFVVHKSDMETFQQLELPCNLFLSGDSKWSRAKERSEVLKKYGISTNLKNLSHICATQKTALGWPCFVFGSPHEAENEVAFQLLRSNLNCLIIYAPHEITPEYLKKTALSVQRVGRKVVLLSEIIHSSLLNPQGEKLKESEFANVTFVLVDRMGMLAELYSLADVAIVGGGFDGQIHNTLEPAAHPVATVFGANYSRAPEAGTLVSSGAALTFPKPDDLFQFLFNCAKLPMFSTVETAFAHQLSQMKLNSLELFKQIPNTSEVVSSALFSEHETT